MKRKAFALTALVIGSQASLWAQDRIVQKELGPKIKEGGILFNPRKAVALPTTPLANPNFEQGQAGWVGTVTRYTPPASSATQEPRPSAATLAGLQQIGGDYWQQPPLPTPSAPSTTLLLPVQGQWCGLGTLQSSVFTLLPAGETIMGDPLGIAPKTVATPTPAAPSAPLYLQFILGDGNIELFLYPRTAAQKAWVESQTTFDIGGTIILNGQVIRDKPKQVPAWKLLPDGSYQLVGTGSGVKDGVTYFTGTKVTNSGSFRRIVLDVSAMRGMNAVIKSTGFVDDFQLTTTITPLPVPPVPTAPPPPPVWGFADTHTHPAAHLGFGGQLYFGAPDGSMEDCKEAHGFKGTGVAEKQLPVLAAQVYVTQILALINGAGILPNLVVNAFSAKSVEKKDAEAIRSALGAAVDSLGAIDDATISKLATMALSGPHATEGLSQGAKGWWKHDDKLHHHMRDESMRRAWQGGLRLMVAHAVNNELLGNMNPKPGMPLDDKAIIDNQIAYIKQMAMRNSAWMEIAYTPADARRIIGQNKLAVVLGIEVDSIGNWGTESDCTDAQVEQELARLRGMGVRHLFPVHLMDSPFAGAALYGDLFLLNQRTKRGVMHSIIQSSPDIQYKAFESIYEMFPAGLLNFAADKLDANKRSSVQLIGGMKVPFAGIARDLERSRTSLTNMTGVANNLGITGRGNFMVNKIMDMGMIIDIDHASAKASEAMLSLASARARNGVTGYPLASGHSWFRELALNRSETSDHHKLGSEAEKPRASVERIRDLGGLVAPITGGKDTKNDGNLVANDAAGTSKSWAQSYLYATRVMGGKGVALGTDMAINGALGPRFGPRSIPGMGEDLIRAQRLGQGDPLKARRLQQGQQNNAVSYNTPITGWHAWKWTGDGWSEAEQDALTALLLAQKGPANLASVEAEIKPVRGIIQEGIGDVLNAVTLDGGRKRILNMALGFRAGTLPSPGIDIFKGPDVQAAVFSAKQWVEANNNQFPDPNTTWQSFRTAYKAKFTFPLVWLDGVDDEAFRENFNAAAVAYATMRRLGVNNNAPLTRSVIGGREFDYNLDGLAHFGMLPDFLQDLKNTGVNAQAMAPLFRSAEDYIRMWEKCDKMKIQ
jgi:microsomal dipeptidase-like Zn-dependent dipeptidase